MADFVSESYVQFGAFSPIHPSASPFGIPSFFTGFSAKTSADTDSARSPTSPLDLVFSTLKNPFGFGCQKPSSPGAEGKRILHCTKVGLGIVNSLADNAMVIGEVAEPSERNNIVMRPQMKMSDVDRNGVLATPEPIKNVGTSLPTAIGRDSHVNNCLVTKPSSLPLSVMSSHSDSTGLSAREIELSEDYTCVICHGPNPKTTHIFCDCILECHTNELSDLAKKDGVGGECIVFTQVGGRQDGSIPSLSDKSPSFCYSTRDGEDTKMCSLNNSSIGSLESSCGGDLFVMGVDGTT